MAPKTVAQPDFCFGWGTAPLPFPFPFISSPFPSFHTFPLPPPLSWVTEAITGRSVVCACCSPFHVQRWAINMRVWRCSAYVRLWVKFYIVVSRGRVSWAPLATLTKNHRLHYNRTVETVKCRLAHFVPLSEIRKKFKRWRKNSK